MYVINLTFLIVLNRLTSAKTIVAQEKCILVECGSLKHKLMSNDLGRATAAFNFQPRFKMPITRNGIRLLNVLLKTHLLFFSFVKAYPLFL